MTVVVRAMHVLLLVRIEVLVHGDDEDIFFRVLVIHDEVAAVVVFQAVAQCLNLIAVFDTLLHILSHICRTQIHPTVQHHLSHHEVAYRHRDASVVVTLAHTV